MSILPTPLQNLIDQFSRLPGIGPRLSSRIVFYLLSKPSNDTKKLAEAVATLWDNLVYCKKCGNIMEKTPSEICPICSDPQRDRKKICLIGKVLDLIALEKTGYNGLYHILGGVISPIDGIGPEDLRISPLLDRLKKENIEEVILATDPSLEGEATAIYLANEIKKLKKERNLGDLKITRIARGLPAGGELEYADEITLTRSLEGRKEV